MKRAICKTHEMKIARLNTAQRIVIVIALGIALFLFGQWLIGYWEFGSRDMGWVAYAPLGRSPFPTRILVHSWVVLLIRFLLIVAWMIFSIALLRPVAKESAGAEEVH